MLDLRNFVKININYVKNPILTRTRDTAVLISTLGDTIEGTFESKEDFENTIKTPGILVTEDLSLAGEVFFDNGGLKLHIIKAENTVDDCAEKIKGLPMEEIAIGFLCEDTSLPLKVLEKIKSDVENDCNGIREKIIVNKKHILEGEELTSEEKLDNYAIKYSSAISDTNTHLFPSDMTILAYLTQVKIESYETVKDYNFTLERSLPESVIVDSNKLLKKIININCNCCGELDEGNIRNIGGNCTSGVDLMNHFMKIVLTQTLTSKIMNVLLTKIKYDYKGLEIVSNSMIEELGIYKNNGFLSTNKVWNNEAWVEKGMTIIDKGDILLNGYKFVISPFSSLTEAQRKAHQFPDIYLVLSTAYGVREVVISGEIY